jgi:polyphosphate kinase 2 (PPK2 family)
MGPSTDRAPVIADIDPAERLSNGNGRKAPREELDARLAAAQQRLLALRLRCAGLQPRRTPTADPRSGLGPGVLVLLEGLDASGKGGSIRRLVAPLDPRHVRVATYAAPTTDDKRHLFLARFVPAIPGRGGMTIMDRSWYGRVLVERVEGFANPAEWERAYGEIAGFERMLVEDGTVVVKLWLHVSPEAQLKRFEERAADPLKSWKLTDEDWRNRARRDDYERAAQDMIDRTHAPGAPWTVIPADDKRSARIRVVESVCAAIEASPLLP